MKIMILTNPAFPEFIKIEIAEDSKKRLEELNNAGLIPYNYELYAEYFIDSELDKETMHNLISILNPNIWNQINESNIKIKDFYSLSKESAYNFFEAIAKLSGTTQNLKLIKATSIHQEVLKKSVKKSKNKKVRPSNMDVVKTFQLHLYETIVDEIKNINKDIYFEEKKQYVKIFYKDNIIGSISGTQNGIYLYYNYISLKDIDPKGLLRDVSTLGHLGFGNGQLFLKPADFISNNDIEYTIGMYKDIIDKIINNRSNSVTYKNLIE